MNGDGSRGTPAAVIPLLHHRVVSAGTEIEERVEARAVNCEDELAWSRIDAHGRNAFGATALGFGNKLHGGGNVAVVSRGMDEDAAISQPCQTQKYTAETKH